MRGTGIAALAHPGHSAFVISELEPAGYPLGRPALFVWQPSRLSQQVSASRRWTFGSSRPFCDTGEVCFRADAASLRPASAPSKCPFPPTCRGRRV